MIAFVFPGQGSQHVGMAKEIYEQNQESKDLITQACDVLKQDLKSLMFEGPTEELTLTENAQPALLVNSVMLFSYLLKQMPDLKHKLKAVAGHSLGEYSANVAAGTIDFADALKMVKLRGRAMQQAVPVGVGAMAAIIGLPIDEIQNVINKNIKTDEICVVANDNCPGQTVISGNTNYVEIVMEACRQAGAKRALPLNVSAPFHSPLMQPAADVMQQAIGKIAFNKPEYNLYTNVTAKKIEPKQNPAELLVQQITAPVRWVEQIQQMHKDGITTFVEVGPGKVLTGMIKRIVPNAKVISFEKPEQLDHLIESMEIAA